MKIGVIGTGYVGLVTGVCLSDLGNDVICVDSDPEKLCSLRRYEVPFYEPGLDEKLKRNAMRGGLLFTDSISEMLQACTFIYIAVGTPPKETGEADISAVMAVVDAVQHAILENNVSDKKILITKSTVPVGTGEKIVARLEQGGVGCERVAVVSNPEFLREGSAVYDFFHPDRIVIGSTDDDAVSELVKLYKPLNRREVNIVRTSLVTAELSKYASNCFLATKISFINEMSRFCELVGADVKDVAKIMGMDGRIGKYFLHAGPGYGGSCFSKDIRALLSTARSKGLDMQLIEQTEKVNEAQKVRVISLLKRVLTGGLKNKKVGVLGLAFKPETDDLREAPSLAIISELVAMGCRVVASDPEAQENAKRTVALPIEYVQNVYELAKEADALILVTEWHVFRDLDFRRLKQVMKQPLFFDLRNVYDMHVVQRAGFKYYSVGRPNNL